MQELNFAVLKSTQATYAEITKVHSADSLKSVVKEQKEENMKRVIDQRVDLSRKLYHEVLPSNSHKNGRELVQARSFHLEETPPAVAKQSSFPP